jgi:hypothetical protein
MLLSLLLFANSVTLYAGPRPEQTAVFKDWITGCDNVRHCSAVALEAAGPAGDGPADHLEILIEQPLGHHLDPVVTVKVLTGANEPAKYLLSIDGAPVKLPALVDGRLVFKGTDARRLLKRMRAGDRMELRDGGELDVAHASLRGLTAALLRIDEQQGRDGTARALVKVGKRIPYDDLPGYSVSLTRPRPSSRPPTQPKAGALPDNRDQCGSEAPEETFKPDLVRLDDDNSMAIVPWACGNGAYVRYSNIMIINGFDEVRPAEFDFDNGITGDGPSNVQAEVVWLEKQAVLESASRFRAIGDCGRIDRYIWDGTKFRLSEQWIMPECRGAFDRIRTWKVGVAER